MSRTIYTATITPSDPRLPEVILESDEEFEIIGGTEERDGGYKTNDSLGVVSGDTRSMFAAGAWASVVTSSREDKSEADSLWESPQGATRTPSGMRKPQAQSRLDTLRDADRKIDLDIRAAECDLEVTRAKESIR